MNIQRCFVENQKGAIAGTKSMAIAPFWLLTEHLWIARVLFWLSTDDIIRSKQSINKKKIKPTLVFDQRRHWVSVCHPWRIWPMWLPLLWAFSNLLKHWPVWTFHTYNAKWKEFTIMPGLTLKLPLAGRCCTGSMVTQKRLGNETVTDECLDSWGK